MNRLKNILPFLFKWGLVLLAVGNLIFLFVFDYQLPGFIRQLFPGSDTQVSETDTSISASDKTSGSDIFINIPSEPLIYDGSGNLDLMNDVTVTDADGTVQTDVQIFSSLKPGTTRKEKIIEYSATDRNGNRITAERLVDLGDNYAGPMITIHGTMPEITDEELPNLIPRLISDNLIRANDGFGKDITNTVIASIKSEADASGNSVVTLTVTNMVNDSYSTDVNIPTRLTGPVIRLTTDKVTITVGESFSFYNYIDFAQDADGNNLSHRITIDGTVDTTTPGEYILEFYCTDSNNNRSSVKTLTVTVEGEY